MKIIFVSYPVLYVLMFVSYPVLYVLMSVNYHCFTCYVP